MCLSQAPWSEGQGRCVSGTETAGSRGRGASRRHAAGGCVWPSGRCPHGPSLPRAGGRHLRLRRPLGGRRARRRALCAALPAASSPFLPTRDCAVPRQGPHCPFSPLGLHLPLHPSSFHCPCRGLSTVGTPVCPQGFLQAAPPPQFLVSPPRLHLLRWSHGRIPHRGPTGETPWPSSQWPASSPAWDPPELFCACFVQEVG